MLYNPKAVIRGKDIEFAAFIGQHALLNGNILF